MCAAAAMKRFIDAINSPHTSVADLKTLSDMATKFESSIRAVEKHIAANEADAVAQAAEKAQEIEIEQVRDEITTFEDPNQEPESKPEGILQIEHKEQTA